jgi:uncharacterized membrane-anchored protein
VLKPAGLNAQPRISDILPWLVGGLALYSAYVLGYRRYLRTHALKRPIISLVGAVTVILLWTLFFVVLLLPASDWISILQHFYQ